MIFELRQTKKELFGASFEIVNHRGCIGNAVFQGRVDSMEVNGKIFYHDKEFSLDPGKIDAIAPDHCFRPYIISTRDTAEAMVCQTRFRDGLFRLYDYHRLIYESAKYDMYPIGFGKEGSKCPVYHNDIQIAQIDKESVVINDLHNYKIYANDNDSAQAALIFAIYMYINGAYKPGVEVKQSRVSVSTTTTNKALRMKYNPDYIKDIYLD